MKRKKLVRAMLFVMVVLMTSLIIEGCAKNDHPIAGKTFAYHVDEGNDYVYYWILFNEKGEFLETTTARYNYHDITNSVDHLKWETDGNNITIRYDKSSTWKPSQRGQVYKTGFYDPGENTVTLGTSPSTYMTYELMF